MTQSSLPELMSQQTTITNLTPAQEAKVSMVVPTDAVNETTGAIETLKVSIGQIIALNRLLGNEVPTGTPIPWLGAALPAGYIREDTAFDPLQYPELAQVFPSNRTPALNERTLKGARAGIGSFQNDQNKAHNHTGSFSGAPWSHNHSMAHTHTRGTMDIKGGMTIDAQNQIGLFQTLTEGALQSRSTAPNNAGFLTGVGEAATRPNGFDFIASRNWSGATSEPSINATGHFSHTPAGTITINNNGASEVRVRSVLCWYMFRAR